MRFIECSHDEIKGFKNIKGLKLGWNILSEHPVKVEIAGKIVALIDFSIGGCYGENSVEIDSFEVFEKGQGIGSEIITEFLKICGNRTISLYPDNEECKRFWIKHGFEIEYEGAGVERLVYK